MPAENVASNSGYVCPMCSWWVTSGTTHICPARSSLQPYLVIDPEIRQELQTIRELLEKLLARTEPKP